MKKWQYYRIYEANDLLQVLQHVGRDYKSNGNTNKRFTEGFEISYRLFIFSEYS